MAQYIDKSVLVAEIEKLKSEALQKKSQCKRHGLDKIMHQIGTYNKILSILDTLDVKEMDLDEVSRHYALNNSPWDNCVDEIQDAYKAGFELGLKAKGE